MTSRSSCSLLLQFFIFNFSFFIFAATAEANDPAQILRAAGEACDSLSTLSYSGYIIVYGRTFDSLVVRVVLDRSERGATKIRLEHVGHRVYIYDGVETTTIDPAKGNVLQSYGLDIGDTLLSVVKLIDGFAELFPFAMELSENDSLVYNGKVQFGGTECHRLTLSSADEDVNDRIRCDIYIGTRDMLPRGFDYKGEGGLEGGRAVIEAIDRTPHITSETFATPPPKNKASKKKKDQR